MKMLPSNETLLDIDHFSSMNKFSCGYQISDRNRWCWTKGLYK